MVDISKFEDKFRIQVWKKDRGGYIPSNIKQDIVETSLDIESKKLGEIIRQLFGEETEDIEAHFYFKTVSDSILAYQLSPGSYLLDIGDRHTDAYQIFVDSENRNNSFAFMIDSGYESFGESDMRQAFERYYGSLLAFSYQEFSDKVFRYRAEAKTENYQIVSYLFNDGDELLEVIYILDLKDPKDKLDQLQTSFEDIIKSITISNN